MAIRLNNVFQWDRAVVEFCGDYYKTSVPDWFLFLRDLMRPLRDDLRVAWQRGEGDTRDRAYIAAMLALLPPSTDGVAEYLQEQLEASRDAITIWLLGELGPEASSSILALESILSQEEAPEEVRAFARRALNKIRPSEEAHESR